ncbi:MAG: phosphotransferase [Paracoccaceae bacterium]|nr:phosphotransferase [Paracoccaceae bacterium]
MQITVKSSQETAERIGGRWSLTDIRKVTETKRAVVYKALGPNGPVALKLYNQIGASGEGAAISFLRQLKPDFGVQVLRVNHMRTAVLMEWLEGPGLDTLVRTNNELEAVRHLATVAKAVAQTEFIRQFVYQRLAPKLQQDFKQKIAKDDAASPDRIIKRAALILDELVQTTAQERVVHGDLGFSNVIVTKDGPRLIDPKGLRADPAHEFGKAMIQAYGSVSIDEYIRKIKSRSEIMSGAIDGSPQRLIRWGAVVLARSSFKHKATSPQRQSLEPYLEAFLDLAERRRA